MLKRLWDSNPTLMIRSICEIYAGDGTGQVCLQNLNRVLDIANEIKESMTKFVNCQDYDFAVALGIIAGKRDYLNYNEWLRERIQSVGTNFVKALVRYLYENVVKVINEQMMKANL